MRSLVEERKTNAYEQGAAYALAMLSSHNDDKEVASFTEWLC